MNPGDMIIQAVSEDLVIQDIRLNVPRGRAIVVPGNLACDSRDLGQLMSQKRIIELGANPRLTNALSTQPRSDQPEQAIPVADSSELFELRSQFQVLQSELKSSNAEVQRLKGELEASRTECGQLLAEGSQLRAEVAKLKAEDSKLSTILDKIDSMPSKVVIQATSGKEVPLDGSLSEESDVPIFIQNFDPPKKMTVKESSSTSTEVATATKALGEFRKKKGR